LESIGIKLGIYQNELRIHWNFSGIPTFHWIPLESAGTHGGG